MDCRLCEVFNPDRVNVNRRERNSPIGIKRNRYHIIGRVPG